MVPSKLKGKGQMDLLPHQVHPYPNHPLPPTCMTDAALIQLDESCVSPYVVIKIKSFKMAA